VADVNCEEIVLILGRSDLFTGSSM